MSSRAYDLVLYGVTGFTGQYVLEQLAKSEFYNKVQFAVAGRSQAKLEKSLKTVGDIVDQDLSKVPILIADSSDQDSLLKVAEQTKVLMSVVGPYRLHGEPVVKACVDGGCSYVDISGEPAFVEKVQAKYHEQAQAKGVYVVSCCGWDSIPCDLGVQFLQKNFNGTVAFIETVAESKPGPNGYKVNDGTYQTLILAIEHQASDNLRGIRREIMPIKLERAPYKPPKRSLIWRDPISNNYVIPFLGADRAVVSRSLYHNAVERKQYAPFINCFIAMGGLPRAVLVILWAALLNVLIKVPLTRDFVKRYPGFCSAGFFSKDGPSREQVKSTTFTYWVHGTGWSESEPQKDKPPMKQLTVRCDGPDMGYVATSGCLLSAALTILNDKDKMPSSGGVYTPAAAFQDTNIWQRLESFNVTFRKAD